MATFETCVERLEGNNSPSPMPSCLGLPLQVVRIKKRTEHVLGGTYAHAQNVWAEKEARWLQRWINLWLQ